MKQTISKRRFIPFLAWGWLANSLSVSAQIVPDATLPNNSSVNLDGQIQQITGGTQAGGNLFHSFEQFNVRTGETAFFDNATSIDNIITRVTGGQLSDIDGIIRANGDANLFLLNPNGIVFGPNARLEIGGSFLGSTADSLLFADGIIFSATNSVGADGRPPLLSINVPIGLQFGANPGSIVNRSQATQVKTNGRETVVGLQVLPENTLALVGGDLLLDGGYMTTAAGSIDLSDVGATLIDNEGNPIELEGASGGRIEVGAVGANSRVQITQQAENPQSLILSYEGVESFRDLQLSQLAVIDASGDGGGDLQIQGRRVTVSEGSQIRSNTLGDNPGGTLSIRASESVEVLGNSLVEGPLDDRLGNAGILVPRETSISTSSFAGGAAGDLRITTPRLSVRDGGEIAAFSFGSGRGGNVLIEASESIEVLGEGILIGLDPSKFFPFGFEIPGYTPRFFREQTLVSLISTTSVGEGLAGNLTLETGQLAIRGGGTIAANPLFGGDGGTLTVVASDFVDVSGTTRNGVVRSAISASATGAGNARDLNITTRQLTVREGGAVQVGTLSTGNAGNLSIEASESVEVSGTSPDGQFPSNLSASTFGTGNAGSLTIKTDRLSVRDGALVEVNSTRSGNAGSLSVVANSSIQLDNRATLNAATASGLGGNLTLRTSDLQLRRGSNLNTNAGSADGGNITIDTNTLVALENSDITANAIQGSGGKVTITTQGIFGTAFREQLTPESDITATSELGTKFSGTVTLTTPDVDASNGLLELQGETTDSGDRILSSCGAAEGSSFTITGRGGLPESPTETLRAEMMWEDLRNLIEYPENNREVVQTPLPVEPEPTRELVEATGWIVREDGTVELVASNDRSTPSFAKTPPCDELSHVTRSEH